MILTFSWILKSSENFWKHSNAKALNPGLWYKSHLYHSPIKLEFENEIQEQFFFLIPYVSFDENVTEYNFHKKKWRMEISGEEETSTADMWGKAGMQLNFGFAPGTGETRKKDLEEAWVRGPEERWQWPWFGTTLFD